MTSFAFILGCVPLAIASGAGALSRQVMGTAVIGGMLAATFIAIFLIPVTFYVVERFAIRFGGKREGRRGHASPAEGGGAQVTPRRKIPPGRRAAPMRKLLLLSLIAAGPRRLHGRARLRASHGRHPRLPGA